MGGVVPGVGDPADNAFINNGGIATAATGVTASFRDLKTGDGPGGSGSLNISGGTINASGTMSFGFNTTGAGVFNISSGTQRRQRHQR